MAFLDMGGYWAYVWPAYALTLTVMVLNVIWARRLLQRSRKEALRRLAMGGVDTTGGPKTIASLGAIGGMDK
jgi:heme exporter protein CcmD